MAQSTLAKSYEAIAIGVSAGGFKALSSVLPFLKSSLPVAVLVVQHMSPDSDGYLIEHLDGLCGVGVKFADDKEPLCNGMIYFAPPNYHLLVESDRSLSLTIDPRVNFSRPSIDVLFESAAEVFLQNLIGVIMTGASSDGTAGLRRIKQCGGLTVAQSPESAEVDTMVVSAIESTAIDHIIALDELGLFLNRKAHGQ